MSLNWDISKIDNYKSLYRPVPEEEGAPEGSVRLNVTTEMLIWMSAVIGMDSITLKNHEEFFIRASMQEQACGAFRSGPKGPEPFTLADVKRHIGLSTNASPLTPAQFSKKLALQLRSQSDAELRRQKQDAEKPRLTVIGPVANA